MDGRNTIIITLKWYFRVADDDVATFDGICDLFLSGLIDNTDEITPAFYDVEAAINTLALYFLPDSQYNLLTIQTDLWMMIVNWWDTVKWARRSIRIPMETEDFLADLVAPIVQEIMGDPTKRPYYKPRVLEALLQTSKPPYETTRYIRQLSPPNINLDIALEYYKQLSHKHGFGDEYPILLQLLFDKFARNRKRHFYFLIQDYQMRCDEIQMTPSYHDYISRRALAISPELSVHCERLFQRLPNSTNVFRS
jgi:hypothetical protein